MAKVRIRSRDDVLDYLTNNCPRRNIVRALTKGTVEFLGGFSKIPPATDPGWIVRCNSPIGGRFHVAVIARNRSIDYGIRTVKRIPWEFWSGDTCGIELYRGDNPKRYAYLKELKREMV